MYVRLDNKFCVFIVPSSNLFPKQMIRSKPHALASTPATPKEKTLPCISDLAGVKFLLKKERVFFLSGFCPPSIRAVRGASYRTRQSENLFLGERIFRFASADFPPAGGSGEECGRVFRLGGFRKFGGYLFLNFRPIKNS